MSELLRFFKDMRDNGYGLAEIAAQLGTSAIAEPVAGFAAMYDPAHGADAIREGMTYQPRTQAAQEYSQSIGNAAKTAIKPAMPIIDTWKKGVDIAGQYSPVVGAGLRTVPTAIGIAMGAKPALQAGQQVSEGLGAMQGRMIANANAPSTLNTAGFRGQRGVFAGINALTADKEALAKAQQMIAQGVDPAEVWKETGWGKGVDGKWRFEINDKYDITDNLDEIGSRFPIDDEITRNLISGRWNGARSTDMLSHDDLYAAYPEFKNMGIAKETGDSLGSINQDGTQAYINNTLLQRSLGGRDISKPDNAHSVLMHEIQHAIQGKEGFARGGSPDQFSGRLPFPAVLNDAQVMAMMVKGGVSKEDAPWEFAKRMGRNPKGNATELLNKNDPDVLSRMTHDEHEAYRRLAGEVEARTTQSRLDLDPQQRRENYPFDYKTYGYDVPAKSQTVDFGNNKANAQRPLTEFEQAHLTAQRNAALPVNQGGLGLSADNTAMDRARAMGFDVEAYHGSPLPDAAEAGNLKISYPEEAVFLADEPFNANAYARSARYPVKRKPQPNVIPVLTKSKNMDLYEFGGRQKDRGFEPYIDAAKRAEKDGVIFNDIIDEPAYGGNVRAILDPKNIRSRFAAFDPFNRDSSNLLAQSAKLAPTTALGAYMYNEKRKKSQGKQ
jgi:hypothetical protein